MLKKKMTKKYTSLRRLAPVFLAVIFLAAGTSANAQALYTAGKGADIFVFGGYSYTVPDYGPSGDNDTGFVLGGDYTRYFGWSLAGLPIDPSLEIRYTSASGDLVKERTGMGGLRVHTSVKNRYHPYIDILFGLGEISYAPLTGYAHDHGTAYSLGGGIDIDLVHHFQLKLDFQEQNWNLGLNAQQVPRGGNYTLTPTAYTIGVSYNIPFRGDVGPNAHSDKPPKERAPRATPQPAPVVVAPPAPDASAPAPAPADTTAPPAPSPADTTTPPPAAPTPAPSDTTTPQAGASNPPSANL